MAGVTLAAAIAFNSISLPARALAEDICGGHTGFYSFSISEGENCPGEKFGKKLCSVDCSKKRVKNPVTLEKLKKAIQQAYKPKRGKTYTVSEIRAARRYLSEWKKSDVLKLVKKLNGNLSEDEKKIFPGGLKYWPLIKYYSDLLDIDPTTPFLFALIESGLIQEKGKSGEIGVMQIMPGTAMEVYKIYGMKDPVIRKAGKNWRKDKDVMIILALYHLRGILDDLGVDRGSLPTDEQKAKAYMVYNAGSQILKNGEINQEKLSRWWQGNNLANGAKKYMRLYPLIENFVDHFIAMHQDMSKKEAVLASKPKTEEKQKRKEALVRKLDTQIANHMVAKEIVKSEIDEKMSRTTAKKDELAVNLKEDVIPHTYFIELQAKKDAEAKAVKEAAMAKTEAAENQAKTAVVGKQTVVKAPLAEPFLVKGPVENSQGVSKADPAPSKLVAQNTAVPRSLERKIFELRASQAELREQIRKFDDFINQLRREKNGRR